MKHNKICKTILFPICLSTIATPIYSCGQKPVDPQPKPVCPHEHQVLNVISPNYQPGCKLPGEYLCTECKETIIKELSVSDVGVPVLHINGDMTGISKDNKVYVQCYLESEENKKEWDYDCTLKWQGNSSLTYNKKNFNMVLYDKDTEYSQKHSIKINNWPKDSKYTLKANYIDYSHLRNIVTARLWGDLIHQRGKSDELHNSFNGGAIDGFPICLSINNTFNGLYTLNVAKGNGQFNMSKSAEKQQAFIQPTSLSNSAQLMEPIDPEKWEIQYCNKEDETWVYPSFNEVINFINNSTDEEFVANISNYLDIDRTIDYLIFIIFYCLQDNTITNILWTTYDGQHWFPSAYDLDTAFGLHWRGDSYYSYDFMILLENNVGLYKFYRLFKDDIIAQYKKYRQNVLSVKHISKRLQELDDTIPKFMHKSDVNKWKKIPSQTSNNVYQMVTFITQRSNWLDKLWQ